MGQQEMIRHAQQQRILHDFEKGFGFARCPSARKVASP